MSSFIFTIENLTTVFNHKIQKKNSKGIDKVRPSNFARNKKAEIKKIKQKFDDLEYKFIPYLEILRTKGRNKQPRVISAASVRDKILLTALKDYLQSVFSKQITNKLSNQVIRELKDDFKSGKYKYCFRTDIRLFYNNINRQKLNKYVSAKIEDQRILKIINDSICNITVPKNELKKNYANYKVKKGIPQGLPISNILAQIYLRNIDKALTSRKFRYYRYVDDIIILSKHNPILLILELKLRLMFIGLFLNKDKSTFNRINKKFSYLGYTFIDNKLSLSEKQISKFITRISGKFTWLKRGLENPESRPDWLVNNDELFKTCFLDELNEKITGARSDKKRYGWLFYFIEIDDISILYRIDNIICNFFTSIDEFDNTPPAELKSIAKTYFDIKYNGGRKYVHNYNDYNTVAEKRTFLINRGKLDPDIEYSDEKIERLFFKYKHKRLSILEKDIGYY